MFKKPIFLIILVILFNFFVFLYGDTYSENRQSWIKATTQGFIKDGKPFRFIGASTVTTVLAIGDFRFAGIYRDFVKYLQKNCSHKILYFGPLAYSDWYAWGYSYYLNRYFPYRELKNNLTGPREIFFTSPAEAVLPLAMRQRSIANDFSFDRFLDRELVYEGHVFYIIENREQGSILMTGGYCLSRSLFEN